jgi:hypothetical protein
MNLFKVIETSFENYDSTIRTYLSRSLGAIGQKFSKSQIFGVIFDGIKGVMQNMLFYIEDALTEQNIDTAYRKTSLYSLAKVSGYEPFYGAASTGIINCDVSLSDTLEIGSNKIYIPNKTVLIDEITGYSYIIMLPTDYYCIDVSKPLFTSQFKVIQGNIKSYAYSATGEPLETLHVYVGGLFDREYVEVYVDGVKYTEAACLYDMTQDSNEYILSVGYDNELDIIFGNGIYGKQLKEGQSVSVSYVVHVGSLGDVDLTNEYSFVFTSPIYDSFGETVSKIDFLTLSLGSQISGGLDSDTVQDIRNMIGYNSRSLVIASENNFRLFFNRFSFIGHSNIHTEDNSLVVNAICTTNYADKIKDTDEYFNAYFNDKILLSESQKQMVKTTLDNSNKTFAGITVEFNDPDIYRYAIIMYLKAESKYDRDTIKSEVSKVVMEYFKNIESNTLFIPKSDIIKAVLDNVSTVESLDIVFISDKNETACKDGYYYKYTKGFFGDTNRWIKSKFMYSYNSTLGLDEFGNIKLDSIFEIPIISNGVRYVPDHSKPTDSFNVDAIQFIFI